MHKCSHVHFAEKTSWKVLFADLLWEKNIVPSLKSTAHKTSEQVKKNELTYAKLGNTIKHKRNELTYNLYQSLETQKLWNTTYIQKLSNTICIHKLFYTTYVHNLFYITCARNLCTNFRCLYNLRRRRQKLRYTT
jgi:hypothetical protein